MQPTTCSPNEQMSRLGNQQTRYYGESHSRLTTHDSQPTGLTARLDKVGLVGIAMVSPVSIG